MLDEFQAVLSKTFKALLVSVKLIQKNIAIKKSF